MVDKIVEMPLMLDGPYCQDDTMDYSYSNKMSDKTKQTMESARELQALNAQYTKMADVEYKQLNIMTSYMTNTSVPGL